MAWPLAKIFEINLVISGSVHASKILGHIFSTWGQNDPIIYYVLLHSFIA